METTPKPTIYLQLAKAQAQFKSAIKDSSNPHFKSKYADLASIWDACKEGLATACLFVSQPVVGTENGWHVQTRVYNEAGEYIESLMPIISDLKNPQTFGSALTYARRYSLASILGIVTDDDDAEAAMNRKPEPIDRKNQPVTNRYDKPLTEESKEKASELKRVSELKTAILLELNDNVFTREERDEAVTKLENKPVELLEKMLDKVRKTAIKRRDEWANAVQFNQAVAKDEAA